jgi:hypothetical protein
MPMMAMDKILALQSSDSEDVGKDSATVLEVIKNKDINFPEYIALAQNMLDVGQTWPIYIYGEWSGSLTLGNGHHRVKIARDLGWTEMEYSGDCRKTGDDWAEV